MKRISLIMLCLSFLLLSCKEGENGGLFSGLAKLSDTENAGIKEVHNFLGGNCEYIIGKSFSSGNEVRNYFEIKISESEGLEVYKKFPQLAGANIAYRFYKNLSEEEKEKYWKIDAKIVFLDGQEEVYEFKKEELKMVDRKMPFLHKVIDIIREKRFNELDPLLNNSMVFQYDKSEFIDKLKEKDAKFEEVAEEGFMMYGYEIYKAGDIEKEVLSIKGIIMRKKDANKFTILLEPYSDEEVIYHLGYEF
ncbi:MAG: hypothetical protein AAF696_29440 [Bacteroidota bacterium]